MFFLVSFRFAANFSVPPPERLDLSGQAVDPRAAGQ
jgi:hypothetical protein